MKYYKILRDDENIKKSDLVCKSVSNYEETYGITKNDLYSGVKIANWDDRFVFEYRASEGNTFSDFIFNNLGWYIISPKVQKILRELNLGDEIQILPVQIREIESNEIVSSYAVLNIYKFVDAFDRDNSDFREKTVKGKTILFIKKFAFQKIGIMGSDLFRVEENKFAAFISEKVVNKFLQNEVTGVDFREIKVS